ncbi:MAG TPA: hypothetical protein VG982_00260 [Candidatus Paceibacterota bacterium]|nr:hypothetical protein [Candidatus Paceibacterota bacterium]
MEIQRLEALEASVFKDLSGLLYKGNLLIGSNKEFGFVALYSNGVISESVTSSKGIKHLLWMIVIRLLKHEYNGDIVHYVEKKYTYNIGQTFSSPVDKLINNSLTSIRMEGPFIKVECKNVQLPSVLCLPGEYRLYDFGISLIEVLEGMAVKPSFQLVTPSSRYT